MPTLPGLYFLKNYPEEQLWRLFVDGRFWAKQNGWEGYEKREKGSLSAGLESLIMFALEANNKDDFAIDINLIKAIHARCGKDVPKLQEKKPGETRTTEPVYFAIPANRASEKGIREFLSIDFIQKYATFGPGKMEVTGPEIPKNQLENARQQSENIGILGEQIYQKMLADGYSKTTHFYIAPEQNVNDILTALTLSYNDEIKEAATLDDKVKIIAKHIKRFELLHPFRDANGRTFVNILMNIMLMQQGLPPATFYEPNVFDLYSTEELAEVIKESMFNTLKIIETEKNQQLGLYGYIEDKDQEKFIDIFDSPSHRTLQNIDFPLDETKKNDEVVSLFFTQMGQKYPLHFAAIYNHDDQQLAELMVTEIDNINAVTESGAPPLYVGRTPLQIAAIVNNKALFHALMTNGANVATQDNDGKTTLHYIAEYARDNLLGDVSNLDNLEFLSIKDSSGKTALHYAAESGNLILMKKLISANPDYLNIKDEQGKTALHYAAAQGNEEIARLLINNNADINLTDTLERTPLSIACTAKKEAMIETLLNSHCAIDSKTLSVITSNKDAKLFNIFIEKNNTILADKAAFEFAIHIGDTALVDKFLESGMDINTTFGTNKLTAIMIAAHGNNLALTKLFANKGADTTLTDQAGRSLIFYAATTANPALIKTVFNFKNGEELLFKQDNNGESTINLLSQRSTEMVMLLIEMGIDLTKPIDNKGNTVLHSTMSMFNPIDAVKELITYAPELANIKNDEGQTPLHYALSTTLAKQKQSIEIVELLLERKINISGKDNQGNSVADTALNKGCLRLYLLLEKSGVTPNITVASDYLRSQDHQAMRTDPQKFANDLLQKVSDNPIMAASQLNELYKQVKNNTIVTPQNYHKATGFRIRREMTNEERTHAEVLKLLEVSYIATAKKIPAFLQTQQDLKKNAAENKFFAEHLYEYLANHTLSQKLDKSMQAELHYKHATTQSKGNSHWYDVTQKDEFKDIKNQYKLMKGDALKTRILADFKESLVGKTQEEIQQLSEDFKQNNKAYQILGASQGLASKTFKLELGSMKAFDKIVDEAKANARESSKKNTL